MKNMRLIKFVNLKICFAVICALVFFGQFSYISKAEEGVATVQSTLLGIEGYTIDYGSLEPGGEIQITFNIHNYSKNQSNSTLLSIDSESDLYPAYGVDNQVYVGNVAAGETVPVQVKLVVDSKFKSDIAKVVCSVSSEHSNNTVVVAIPAHVGNKLAVKSIDIAKNAVLGGKSLLNISLNNRTGYEIKDAKLLIEGNISSESKEIVLGDIGVNSNFVKDCYISFEKVGKQSILIKLEYTSDIGEDIVSDIGTYSVNVSENDMNISDNMNDNNGIVSKIGKVLALISIVAALGFVLLYINKRR